MQRVPKNAKPSFESKRGRLKQVAWTRNTADTFPNKTNNKDQVERLLLCLRPVSLMHAHARTHAYTHRYSTHDAGVTWTTRDIPTNKEPLALGLVLTQSNVFVIADGSLFHAKITNDNSSEEMLSMISDGQIYAIPYSRPHTHTHASTHTYTRARTHAGQNYSFSTIVAHPSQHQRPFQIFHTSDKRKSKRHCTSLDTCTASLSNLISQPQPEPPTPSPFFSPREPLPNPSFR